jgi:hypothetical protein
VAGGAPHDASPRSRAIVPSTRVGDAFRLFAMAREVRRAMEGGYNTDESYADESY